MSQPHPQLRQTSELINRLLDGDISAEQRIELENLVCESSECRQLYIRLLHQQAVLRPALGVVSMPDGLALTSESSEQELLVSPENIRELLEEDAVVEQRKAVERARIETLAAEKFAAFRQEQDRNRRPEPVAAPRNAFYATVSTLAAAAILFILWMLPDPVPVVPTPMVVASIDDSIDARWSDPSLSTAPGTQLFTLNELVLTKGVVQIGFEGGAKMVVEAPATLELLSADSARLAWGKLVGRVPRDDVELTIQTPNASITDLGTEFGVEVNRQQVTHLHVFEGRVAAATLDVNGKTTQQRTVLVDEAVSLQPKTGAIEPASAAAASRFVRHVPIPMPRFSTGVGLAVGDADPNWQIVAAQNVPGFVPQQAIVTAPPPGDATDASQQTQWVSLAAQHTPLPGETQFTFRMTLGLGGSDMLPNRLLGGFCADNLVTAIRVNGTSVTVPKHTISSYPKGPTPFVIAKNHLKVGQNIIEFDVYNAGKRDGVDGDSVMALWVRWKGGR